MRKLRKYKLRSQIIAFDLDGTVLDSSEAIYNSVAETVQKFSLQEIPKTVVIESIGRPISELFSRYNLKKSDMDLALKFFRAHLVEVGSKNTLIYPGILETITYLHSRGVFTAIATNKNTLIANTIIDKLNLNKYFNFVCGQDMALPKPSNTMLKVIESKLNAKLIALVGDTEDDVISAQKHKIISIAIASGLQSFERLSESNPDFLIKSATELKSILEWEIKL